MIPLRDENPTDAFPLLTTAIIVANVAVFIWGNLEPQNEAALFNVYSLVPINFIHSPVEFYSTIFSSMFIHSGFMHLAGNLLFLWIFGDNIEDVLGKFRFLLFYLLCGALAAFGHMASDLNSQIPMVGASGAISGILGAYLVLFPFAKIRTLIFLGFFVTVVRIPAIVLLLIWLGIQISSSLYLEGGVAWFAHIGGFAAGFFFILPFKSKAMGLLGVR